MNKKLIVILLTGLAVIGWLPFQYKKIQIEKDFAEYLLIREAGVYTLLSTKPITSFVHSYKKVDDPKPVETKPMYGLEFTKSNHFDKDPSDLWKYWKKKRPLNSSQFCLVSIKDKFSENLYFVNKNSVREALQKYYPEIAQHIGEDFKIDDVINTINRPDSYFWTNIFSHYLVCGIFYGYGFDNSEKFKTETSNGKFSNPIADVINARFKKNVSLNDLPLPMFKSFSDPDPMIENYKKERKQLQQQYAKTDLRKALIEAFSR